MTEHLTTAIENARQALAAGHTQNAFELGAFILERHPDSLDGIELKAGAEQARGDWRAAEDTLRRAIAVAPHLYTPFQYLAQILQATGRTDEADAVIRETLAIHPTHPDAHGMLGVRLSQTGSLIAANWHLREALRLGPRQAPLVALLGHNLAQLGNNDEAERLLAEAIATEPHVLLPRIDYARTLERSEKFDEARKEMAEAGQMAARLGQDIGFQEALLLEATGEWQSALAKLEATTTPTGGTLLTRGRLKDRAGRYEEAWADFVAGKARQQHDLGKQYDRKGVDTHIARLTEFFSEPRLASLPKARVRHNLPQPIFIMGFPRSGTTMTEQLLTAHARIRAGDELPFAAELAQFAVQILGSYPQGLIELVAADRHHLASLLRDFYFARAETYGLLKPGADFFTDKMPLNELYLPLLRIAFPEAPMIIVRRHPLDILVSVMGHNLTHGFNCGFAAEDTAHHIAAISGLIAHWRDVGIDMLTLRYETFVRDQSAETERLMRYIGLEVEPAQINFHTNRRIAPTPSYAQVREPLYDRSIGRWRHYSEALAAVRPILAETIEREGYEG